MSASELFAFGEKLVRLRLLDQTRIDESLRSLGSAHAGPDDLLALLESRSLLTSYQVSRIKKGEWDELVLGDFKLMYQNASGSFARVFRAASVRDGGMVGMKVLRQRWAQEPKHVRDFHREAELGMTLQHENIVPIYAHGTQGNSHYLVMEFVEGGNLRDFIQIRKQLSPQESLRYGLDISRGLEYALRMGYTHRDLKLTNVLMSSVGVAKLVDFGLAGTDDEAHHQRAVEYATLEKATGAPANDPRSDLFFLGTILYELLSGRPPYRPTGDIAERKLTTRYSQIRPLAQSAPQVPRSVSGIVDRLLSFQPQARYQSAGELIRDMRQVLDELEISLGGTTFQPGSGSTVSPSDTTSTKQLPMVMCVEHRVRQQNVLREYLSKRGFRPLMLGNVDRALSRLASNPPDCLVLFGESIEDDLYKAFEAAVAAARKHPLAIVAVLAKEQNNRKSELRKTSTVRVLPSPITLRDLRKEIHIALQHLHQDSGELNAVSP